MSAATREKAQGSKGINLQVEISPDAHALLTSIAGLTRQPSKARAIEALIYEKAEAMGLPLESLGFSAP